MESQSALSESDDDHQINDEYFIEKAMKEAVQTRIQREIGRNHSQLGVGDSA